MLTVPTVEESERFKKLLSQTARQQRELKRLKAKSAELLRHAQPERRQVNIPVAIDRRYRDEDEGSDG